MYYSVEELPYSCHTSKQDSRGRPITQNRFIDVVFFVGVGESAAYHGDVFTVGIEVKSNLFDLLRDNKISYYRGKTDFFYLAVEDGLMADALKKVQSLPDIGVFSLTTGHLCKLASRQTVKIEIRRQLLYRALFSSRFPIKHFTIPQEAIDDTFQVARSSCEDDPKESSCNRNISLTTKHQKTMNFVGIRTPELRPVRLQLKNGKFSLWKGHDELPEEYDYAEGRLIGIDIRRKETSNGDMIYCDFHFINGDERFDISTGASSCVTADLISRLKNVQDPVHSTLRIDAWKSDRYTNVVVKENGYPVTHAPLPRVQKIDRGVRVELDSSARDTAVTAIIEELNAKLLYKN